MAFILYFMNYLLKWAVCFCKLLSFVFNDIVCNLYFKIVLILLLLEDGDIEMNPGPDTMERHNCLMLRRDVMCCRQVSCNVTGSSCAVVRPWCDVDRPPCDVDRP